MKIISKKTNRRGFTLLEMVLVLAIMMIVSIYLVSTFKIVNYSHLKVTKVNDMHDYATLNLHAIENTLCNATVIQSGTAICSDGNYVLLNGGHILPSYDALINWSVTLKISSYPASRTIKVSIDIKDPTSDVGYHDESTFLCPACEEMHLFQNSEGVNFSYEAP